jgi:large repetitive protein
MTSGSLPAGLTLSTGGMIAGTPTAAASSTFTVQASDSESPAQTKSVTLTITINATAAACALSGKQLAFEITGSDSTGFAAMIGSVKVASDTSLTGALDFRNQSAVSANQSISGAAGSCADGSVANTGSLTFTAGGITRTIDYAMRPDGTRGFLLESDPSGFKGSGEIQVQTAPTAGLGGSYAFGLEGASTTAYFYVAGAACTNSSGGITFLQADFSVSGTLFPTVGGASSNPGIFSAPDSNGRVTTTSPISYSNGTTVDTTGYLIDGTKAYVLDTGGTYPGGSIPVEVGIISGKSGSTCLPLGQGGSFTSASFGNSVFSARGVSSCSGCAVTVGGFVGVVNNFNSSAGTASLTDDGLSNGVGGELDSGSPLTYSVSSAGRVSVMNTNTSGKISTSWVYLDGTGNGYLMVGDSKGKGIALGVVQPQTATTVGPGTFAFGTELLTPATSPTFYPVTEVTFTATTLTDLASGGSTGSYTCDSVGRCTAPSLSNNVTFGDSSIVFYAGGNTDSPTSSNFILVLQTTAANADGGTLIQ